MLRAALSAVGGEANKGYAFVERGIYFTKRYWAWEAVWVTYNIVNALAVTFIARTSSAFSGGTISPSVLEELIVYLAIGTAVWTYI